MKNLNNVIVERLNKYLDEKKLTQYRLAELSGVSFATIKYQLLLNIMQRRTKTINLKTIILLSSGLGVTPWEFICDNSFLAENLDLD